MSQFYIQAAGFLGADGYGNDGSGLRPWPPSVGEALRQGEMGILRWSTLFASETSRFSRMDVLSRFGLMAAELIAAAWADLGPDQRDTIGVCLETHTGSLATDARFLQMPLASTFAYTLPSTVVGEICIRHRFRGPVRCLLPPPGQGAALETALGWLERGEVSACLCVTCDWLDKEVAARLALPDDYVPRDWQGGAVWVGSHAGLALAQTGYAGPLSSLARSLCRAPDGTQ